MKSQARPIAVLLFCITLVMAGATRAAATPAAYDSIPGQKDGASSKKPTSTAIKQHMKIDQFDSMSTYDRATYLQNYIQKVGDALAPVNSQLPKAVHDYFYKEQPDGNSGLAKFTGVLLDEEDQAKQGKLDLSKVEVDGIVLALVKRDVLPHFTKTNPPPKTGHQ